MTTPLSWDTPGLLWDSAHSWDSAAAAPPRTMSTIKAITDFTGESNLALKAIAEAIHTNMTLNAATFPNPTVTMVVLNTQITDYTTKLAATASRTPSDLIAFDAAREVLEESLRGLGNYVNSVALGSAAIVVQSGFPSYDTTRVPDYTPPDAPQNLRVTHGELSGSLIVRYKPERSGSTNEIQVHLGDPNDEAGWMQKLILKGAKGEITGLPPGVIVWVRVRSVGLKGVMGVWSDPAQIRTL